MMNMYGAKTYSARPADIRPKWHLVDAQNETLGRLASRVAHYLRGKHKVTFTRHMDDGDYVVVVNVSKIAVTGNKANQKQYYRHTGYPGGIKQRNFNQMMAHQPDRVIRLAVQRMLPRGPLGRKMIKKLKTCSGAAHAHHAQKPVAIRITKKKYQHEQEGA